MVEITCRGDEYVLWRIDTVVKVKQHLLVKFLDGILCAQDRLPEPMSFPEVADEHLMQHKLRLVRFHLDLFENDAFFFLDIRFPEQWIQHQVGQDIQGKREMLIKNFRIEADQFLAGECIQATAY